MTAEIITIGDEILIGQIVDTNSVFISKELNKIGVSVYQITSIQDDKQHILEAFDAAQSRVDLVIITGGLGPTKDDITKHTICEYFEDRLVHNQEVLEHITFLFKEYVKKPLLEANKTQAEVPSKAEVLLNRFGTAPGMWLVKGNTIFVSMPGVPHEMKGIMTNEVLPRLQEKCKLPFILHKTFLTYGMGESAIAERIEAFESDLPPSIKLAYLPSLGKVRLRLSSKGSDQALLSKNVEEQCEKLLPLISDIFTGYEDEGEFEEVIANLLIAQGKTLAIAESCTGGNLVERFTSHPGASKYLKGSLVTYATQSKIDILGVDAAIIEKHSVVSSQVAEQMAANARKLYKSDIAIATTGNAGPTKGDSDVEVGTIYIGIATKDKVQSYHFMMGNHRERVIGKTVNKSLELLKALLIKK
ncbi:competence/damage-inducible protein A [Dokdonia sp. Hel_I_53]|uniref:competence/damage-inducible protein A n=1 Tax=Dokdonia sp. Hel_I_53 TaxID=1566287 RepID=UPI00119A8BD6|nr:competence/damage-inducible protein A [Dokdonia sp. Hel_I_53]TVZ53290.1 nicotinamide-nucleotide amidase [Dokdonia sp. Hel_I_53]